MEDWTKLCHRIEDVVRGMWARLLLPCCDKLRDEPLYRPSYWLRSSWDKGGLSDSLHEIMSDLSKELLTLGIQWQPRVAAEESCKALTWLEKGSLHRDEQVDNLEQAREVVERAATRTRQLVCPLDERWEVRAVEGKGLSLFVGPEKGLKAGEVVGYFEGYVLSSTYCLEGGRYLIGCPAQGPGFVLDPTYGPFLRSKLTRSTTLSCVKDPNEVCEEWKNCAALRVNEPSPGQTANCVIVDGTEGGFTTGDDNFLGFGWPRIVASQDVEPGNELLVHYGTAYAPLRDYATA
jgi:hypothetical protein